MCKQTRSQSETAEEQGERAAKRRTRIRRARHMPRMVRVHRELHCPRDRRAARRSTAAIALRDGAPKCAVRVHARPTGSSFLLTNARRSAVVEGARLVIVAGLLLVGLGLLLALLLPSRRSRCRVIERVVPVRREVRLRHRWLKRLVPPPPTPPSKDPPAFAAGTTPREERDREQNAPAGGAEEEEDGAGLLGPAPAWEGGDKVVASGFSVRVELGVLAT